MGRKISADSAEIFELDGNLNADSIESMVDCTPPDGPRRLKVKTRFKLELPIYATTFLQPSAGVNFNQLAVEMEDEALARKLFPGR
jgi:hypothetical protein